MNTHIVLKPLPAEVMLSVGTEVDASEWRNLDLLVDQRYLKPIPQVGRKPGRPPKKEQTDEQT